MKEAEAERRLRAAGHDWHEAFHLLYAVRLERVAPQSRRKANRYARIEQVLREAGVEPEDVEFIAGSYGSSEWLAGGR